MPESNGVRHNRATRAIVVQEFRRTARVDLACAAAGIDRSTHYEWLRKFPAYAADIEAAREQVAGLLEDEAIRRAYQGTMRPVTVAGQMVMVTEFSDRLLEFLLKCRNRAVFGDRQILTGENGAPLNPARAEVDAVLAELEAYNKKDKPE